MIKVFGHKSPDTDSVCAAIVYAWYLNQTGSEAKAYILGEPNREALFVLEKFGQEKPEILELAAGDDVAIIDTNNPEELPGNINEMNITSIVDHHKLVGGLSTEAPIPVIMKPYACTMSVIMDMAKMKNLEIPKEIAGLMLAGIMSDTLKFTSPTTTDIDKDYAKELEGIAGLDMEALANEMFEAKSDLSGMSGKDILLMDSKIFELGGKKLRVAVIETTKPENSFSMEADIKSAYDELKQSEGLDGLMFFVVDILKSEATLFGFDAFEIELGQKAFDASFNGNKALLPGVVSRKKQMIPNLEKALS